ncbi:MAG: oligosaccharide flippase family protein [Proteobacteria bacterium]|nr:oligosaccharide flippase family protein [Pseudomonadota bacterium]
MNETKSEADLVKTAGRGVIYITFAKLWFLLTGMALIPILPRLFKWSAGGNEELGMAMFGAYGIVFTGVSFINNGIITGTIQAVSKFTSEDERRAGPVRRLAFKLQGGLGLLIAGLYIAAAGPLADHWFESPSLAPLMRLSAGVIVAYSCYAVFIGSFNGQRLFSRQALFDIVYTTTKCILMVALVAAGFGVLGTVMGFLIAATVISIAAGIASRGGEKGTFPAKTYFSFAIVIIVYTFVLNLVMMLDIYLLAGIVPRLAQGTGAAPESLAQLTEIRAGQYKAVQQLAFIPYQAVLAIAFVAFPIISKVSFSKDREKTRTYVRTTLRFTTILIVGLATVFAAVPSQALGLVFQPEYQVAAPALRILPLGIAAFGLMVVSNTIINAAGHLWRAMGVVLVSLAAVIGAVLLFVSRSGPGPEALSAAAMGTTVGMVVGLAISGVVVKRRFGTFWSWLSTFRVVIAAALAMTAGYFMPDLGKVFTIVECLAILLVYFVALIVLREFGREDLSQLKQVLRRGN